MYGEHYNSIWWGLSPMLLVVGLIYHVLSMALPHWMEDEDGSLGLWSYSCNNQACRNGSSELLDSIESWYKPAQGMEGIAIVCVVACLFFGLLRVNKDDIRWQWWCSLSGVLAGIFTLIGCFVFGLGQPRPPSLWLSYAFVFNVVSGCFCLLASPVLYLDVWWRRR